MLCFPSREGIKGCVTERRAGWAEIILLLFGEEVSIGFERLLLILGGYARASHTPGPSREGRFGCLFLISNEWFVAWGIPLLRGDQGVCDGEMRGLG